MNKIRTLLYALLVLLSVGGALGALSDYNANQVAYWTLDESGTTLVDIANGYDLTAKSDQQNSTAKLNYSHDFWKASTQWANISNSASKGGLALANTDYTINLWVNFNSLTGTRVFGNSDGTLSYSGYSMYWSTGGMRYTHIINNPDYNTWNTGWIPTTHTWYMVTIVYNDTSGMRQLFVNGAHYANQTTSTGLVASPLPFSINERSNYLDQEGDQTIDEFSIWNTSLNYDDIATLYASGSPTTAERYPYSAAPTPSNVTLTASDSYTGVTINNFSATVNGTTYTTTTGTITTNLLDTDTNLYTIIYESSENGGYLNLTYTNINFSIASPYAEFESTGNNYTLNNSGVAPYLFGGFLDGNLYAVDKGDDTVKLYNVTNNYQQVSVFDVSSESSQPSDIATNGSYYYMGGNGAEFGIYRYDTDWTYDGTNKTFDREIVAVAANSTRVYVTFNNLTVVELTTGLVATGTTYDLSSVGSDLQSMYIHEETGMIYITVNDYQEVIELDSSFTTTGTTYNLTTTVGGIIRSVYNDGTYWYTISTDGTTNYLHQFYEQQTATTEGLMYQSTATFYAYNRVSNQSILGLTASVTNNTATATNPTLNLSTGSYTATISKTGYFSNTATFNTTALDELTQNVSLYDAALNVTINVVGGSSTDQNFTINLYSLNYSYHEQISTTNGEARFNITSGSYTLYVNDSIHTFTAYNVTINDSSQTTITNVTIDVYGTNTLSIRFFDSDTLASMNGTLITAYITGNIESYNFTTSNGTYYIELLEPDNYTITYDASGYFQGERFFSLTNRTYNSIDLFLVPDNETEIIATVIDELTATVSGAIIRLQQKNLSGTNYYEVDNCVTSPAGTCILHANVGEVTYRAQLEYGGEVKRLTSDFKFTGSSITFRITLGENPLTEVDELQEITGSFVVTNTSSNATWTLTWSDSTTNTVSACIDVVKITYGQRTNTTTCSSGSSGTFSVTDTFGSVNEICGNSYFVASGQQISFSTECIYLDDTGVNDFGTQGLFLFLVMLVSAVSLSLLVSSNASIAIPATLTALVVFGAWIGFLSLTQTAIGGIIVVGVLIVVVVSKR